MSAVNGSSTGCDGGETGQEETAITGEQVDAKGSAVGVPMPSANARDERGWISQFLHGFVEEGCSDGNSAATSTAIGTNAEATNSDTAHAAGTAKSDESAQVLSDSSHVGDHGGDDSTSLDNGSFIETIVDIWLDQHTEGSDLPLPNKCAMSTSPLDSGFWLPELQEPMSM